jgi:biopolymer transport protein ExbB
MQTLFDRYVIQGGVMMIALIPCLVLMIAFVIQGFLNLRHGRVVPRDFAERIRKARRDGGLVSAREVLAAEDHSLAEIIRNVDAHLSLYPDADPAEVLREQIAIECDALIQQNSQLGLIYRITPLMGLLGTVFGMITTFNDFTASRDPDIQELSKGINVALVTTAWGLAIAIPAYIGLYLIQRRIGNYEQLILPREGAEVLHVLLDRPIIGSTSSAYIQLPDSIPPAPEQ